MVQPPADFGFYGCSLSTGLTSSCDWAVRTVMLMRQMPAARTTSASRMRLTGGRHPTCNSSSARPFFRRRSPRRLISVTASCCRRERTSPALRIGRPRDWRPITGISNIEPYVTVSARFISGAQSAFAGTRTQSVPIMDYGVSICVLGLRSSNTTSVSTQTMSLTGAVSRRRTTAETAQIQTPIEFSTSGRGPLVCGSTGICSRKPALCRSDARLFCSHGFNSVRSSPGKWSSC